MMNWEIREGGAFEQLKLMESESVQCVVTSPPYWGLRDYGVNGQLGLEATLEEYTIKTTEIFREVRRVLRKDGTLWLNMGDCYNAYNHNRGPAAGANKNHHKIMPLTGRGLSCIMLKNKDLVGIPWRVAFALQADGWYLRSDNIWSKPNPMPESIRDRPTRSHEYLFLLSKSARYYYDADAIKEEVTGNAHPRGGGVNPKAKIPEGWDTGSGGHTKKKGRYKKQDAKPQIKGSDRMNGLNKRWKDKQNESFSSAVRGLVKKRNKRSVWTIPTEPYPEAHFATFPLALVEPCIQAGTKEGDVVLDPFCGAGTTGIVALRYRRRFMGIELNPKYCEMARSRIRKDMPLFA